MKISKTIFFLASIFIFSCGNKGDGDAKPTGTRDTIQTWVIYNDGGKPGSGFVDKVLLDSVKYKFTDTITDGNSKKLMRDSFYIFAINGPIDSATARINKLPMKDSAGRPTVVTRKYDVPAAAVVFDANVDVKKLIAAKFPTPDTTKK